MSIAGGFARLKPDKLPPWLLRFVKQAGRGIQRYGMIADGDRILLGISGGKDSLALALALALRRRWLPISYELEAVQIDWTEYPLSEQNKRLVSDYFAELGIPFGFVRAGMIPPRRRKPFSCYLCSRNRKRILFNVMSERGMTKFAFGHHLDDLVETTLINLCLRGGFATMMPVQRFFDGKFTLIRPLCEVREQTVDLVARRLELPVVKSDCPFNSSNIRNRIKPIIRELAGLHRHVRENIYQASFNVYTEYLPSNLHIAGKCNTFIPEASEEE